MFTVGRAEGDASEMLGSIAAVAFSPDGTNIFALDRSYGFVRQFTAAGDPVQVIGSKGDGPGQFLSPRAIAVDDSSLIVADAYGVIVDFRRDGREWIHFASHKVPFDVEMMCLLGPDLAFKTMKEDEGGVIEIYRRTGDDLSAVGATGSWYRDSDPFIRWNLSEGRIGCDPQGGGIAELLGMIPTVNWYDAGIGTGPRWRITLNDYVPLKTVTRGTAVERHMKVATFDYPGLLAIVQGHLLIQTLHRTPESTELGENAAVHTYLVELESGTGWYVGHNLPHLMTVGDDRLISFSPSPYPQLTVHQY